MSTKLNLKICDSSDNIHDLVYTLANNDIANAWYKKILHLRRIPLCNYYTYKTSKKSLDELNLSITQDLQLLNDLIDLNYQIKQCYDQQDCNHLHDITVSTQYNHSPEIRDIFHRMHRNIHCIEEIIQKFKLDKIYAGWGEKEGLLESKFREPPYELYQFCSPGTINLTWSEFGKTPYQYWSDHDIDDVTHFLKTCKPHNTFRAQFVVALSNPPNGWPTEFDQWFDQWKEAWQATYGCDWIPLYEWGGIPLAYPEKDFDWSLINTVVSIDIL